MDSVRSSLALTAVWILTAALPASSQTAKSVYTISTYAGGTWVGDGGPATKALLTQPEGVAADSRGNVYIADPADHRVRRIGVDGVIQTVAGTGKPGFSGDGGPAENASLNSPYGICLDRVGNVYIADLGNARVRKVGTDGRISTFAGGGTIVPGGSGDGGLATDAKLNAPRNVTADGNGNVYISDFLGHRVLKVSITGAITTAAGSGTSGFEGDGMSAPFAKLSFPAGLTVDSQGILYIADSGNRRIRRVIVGMISTYPAGSLQTPTGLAVDSAGNLYIQDGSALTHRIGGPGGFSDIALGGGDIAIGPADQIYVTTNRVVKRLANNSIQTIAGAGTSLYAGDGGPLTSARFNWPTGLSRDIAGNLYIVDSRNLRVRRVNTLGILSTFAGDGQSTGANGSLATAVHLAAPRFAVPDSRGNVYISDYGSNRIRKVASDGSTTTVAGSDQQGFAGDGWLGLYAQTKLPVGLAIDSADNLYFADSENHRIRKITPEGLIYTVAGGGTLDSLGDGGPATQARLSSPWAVAVDSAGNLYISDTGNGRVRKVDRSGIITTVGDKLMEPRGLKVFSGGDVIVTDSGDHTVRRITPAGLVTRIAGTTSQGFSGDGGPADAAALDTPLDVLIESDGSILISDAGNGRIRRLTPVDTVLPPDPIVSGGVSLVNAASQREQGVAAGALVSILNAGAGPKDGVSGRLQADGAFPTTLSGVQVLFDGKPAPLLYVSESQINLQVPYSVAGRVQTEVTVTSAGTMKVRFAVPVREASPAIFTLSGGTGQVIAINEDGVLNGPDHPAPRGSVVVLYATGDGVVLNDSTDGRAGGVASFRIPVSVEIGGAPVDVLYAGRAPGLLGMMQINARIGSSLVGLQEVILRVRGQPSQSGATIAIQ